MEVIVVICTIGIIAFLFSRHINIKAKNGNLASTSVIYLNGYLGYQSGVDVNIQANPDMIIIDGKHQIPIQKISNVQITQTKQLTEEQKSVIGRAVVGTLLAGGIGGLVGGMSGVGVAKKTEDVEILYITHKDTNNIDHTISFAWRSIDEKSVVLNSWVSGLIDKIKR